MVHSLFSYLTKNLKSVLYVCMRGSPQSIWIRCYFQLYFCFHFAFSHFLFQLKYIESPLYSYEPVIYNKMNVMRKIPLIYFTVEIYYDTDRLMFSVIVLRSQEECSG
jgi:hypothetical protein